MPDRQGPSEAVVTRARELRDELTELIGKFSALSKHTGMGMIGGDIAGQLSEARYDLNEWMDWEQQ